MSNMRRYFCFVGIFFLISLTESQSQRQFRRPFKYFAPSDVPESIDQRLFPGSYAESPRSLYRNSPKEREEVRPLCEEERKSQSIWELIYASASNNFLQTRNELDLKKYNLIPSKVDVIQCISRKSDEPTGAVCKPENCRERRVDVEVFGRLKNETGNVWEFVGTLSSIPVACECFIRLKPEKCLRSVDVFADF